MISVPVIIALGAGLALGALFGLWFRSQQIEDLREAKKAKDERLRIQGRELGELRAAEQGRQDQRRTAAKAAGAASKARAEAKRQANAAIDTAKSKVTRAPAKKPARSGKR